MPNIKNHLASKDKVYGVKNRKLLEQTYTYKKVVENGMKWKWMLHLTDDCEEKKLKKILEKILKSTIAFGFVTTNKQTNRQT